MKYLLLILMLTFLTGCRMHTFDTRTWVQRELADNSSHDYGWIKETRITISREVEYYPVSSPDSRLKAARKHMLTDNEMDQCVRDFKEYLENSIKRREKRNEIR